MINVLINPQTTCKLPANANSGLPNAVTVEVCTSILCKHLAYTTSVPMWHVVHILPLCVILYERQNKGSTFYPNSSFLKGQLPPEELTGEKGPVSARARALLARHFEISVERGASHRHNGHALTDWARTAAPGARPKATKKPCRPLAQTTGVNLARRKRSKH
jgi:hypothetical protein